MNCKICGGTESYTHNGVDYCQECSNQFMDSRDEDTDESFSRKSLLSSPDVAKKVKDKKKLYAPWISVEAFNIILAKQVSALVKLGCSEKVKTVVLHIWCQYLQKCEIAFPKDSSCEEYTPHLSAFASKRDKQLLYGDGRAEKSWRYSKGTKSKMSDSTTKRKNKLGQKINQVIKEEPNCSADENTLLSKDVSQSNDACSNQSLEMNQSLELTNDSTASTSTEDSDSPTDSSVKNQKKKKRVYSSMAKKLKRSKTTKKLDFKRQESCVHHMTLSKTLSFCQLGLLYTEDQLLLSDLIRLVNEGNVPYIDVTRYFPPSMQLQADDHKIYSKYITPEMKRISLMSAKLFDFLNLPKFKHPSLLPIATRFIKDLNLPNDIIPVVKILINELEAKRDEWYITKRKGMCYSPIPPYEAQAMSVVVVALKMLLILDGKFEIEHGEVMTKLNAVVEDDIFFIWTEWKQQAALKEYLFMKGVSMNTDMNRLDSLSAFRIIGGYPYSCLNQEQNMLLNEDSKKERSAMTVLKTILERLITDNALRGKPTSFPLRHQLQRLMTEWERLPLYKETKEIDFSFICKDFSHHKLCYRPCAGSSNSEDLIKFLLSSLYQSVDLLHMRPTTHYREKIIRTSTKYWHINILNKTLVSDVKEKWLDDLPSSFKWLLKFLCKYLQINCADLYLEIKNIERKLFAC